MRKQEKSLLKKAGSITGYIIGLICGMTAVFTLNTPITIEVRWFFMIGFVVIAAAVVSILAMLNYRKALEEGTKYPVAGYMPGSDGYEYLYTEFTDSLRIRSIVTVYYGIDKIVCHGEVYNTIPKTRVDIKVMPKSIKDTELFGKVKNLNKEVIDRMYILPIVSTADINSIADIVVGEKNG